MAGELSTAVRAAVNSLDVLGDRATAELAIEYATAIDNGGDLAKLGPGLLNTLDALMLTPRAHKPAAAVAEVVKMVSPLALLRERRNERQADRQRAVGE